MVGQPLLEERDAYLASAFLGACQKVPPNSAVVAVVGAAHVSGVKRQLERLEEQTDFTQRSEYHALQVPWSERKEVLAQIDCGGTIHRDTTDNTNVPNAQATLHDGLQNANDVVVQGLVGLIALSFVPTGIGIGAWRFAANKAKHGNDRPLMYFRRARAIGIGVGVVTLGVEISLLSRFINNLRTLQIRWHDAYSKNQS